MHALQVRARPDLHSLVCKSRPKVLLQRAAPSRARGVKCPGGELDFRFESLPEGNRDGHSQAICIRVKCGECLNSEAPKATSVHGGSFEFRHGLRHYPLPWGQRGTIELCAQTRHSRKLIYEQRVRRVLIPALRALATLGVPSNSNAEC